MAVPTHVYSTSSGAATAVTPTAPGAGTINTNDIGLLAIDTVNAEAASLSAQGTGWGTWAQVTGSPVTGASGGTSGGTRLTVFWARATQNNPTMPTVADSGDHQNVALSVYRGVHTSGDPWEVTQASFEDASDTSGSATGNTTTLADCLIVLCASGDLPDSNSTGEYGTFACTNATSPTERADRSTNAGSGGAIAVAHADKATAGAFGPFTYTKTSAARKAHLVIALKQPQAIAHTATPSDTASGADADAKAVTHPVADSAEGADASSRAVGKPVADTGQATDSASTAWAAQKAPADSAEGADAQAKAVTHPVADTAEATDQVTATRGIPVQVDDTASGADATTKQAGPAVADTAQGADATARAITKVVADSIEGTDTAARSSTHPVADTISGADSVQSEWEAFKLVEDGAAASDSVTPSLSGGATNWTRQVDDSAHGSDQASPTAVFVRAIADDAIAADALSRSLGVAIADTATGSDALASAWTALRLLSDALGAADSASPALLGAIYGPAPPRPRGGSERPGARAAGGGTLDV